MSSSESELRAPYQPGGRGSAGVGVVSGSRHIIASAVGGEWGGGASINHQSVNLHSSGTRPVCPPLEPQVRRLGLDLGLTTTDRSTSLITNYEDVIFTALCVTTHI